MLLFFAWLRYNYGMSVFLSHCYWIYYCWNCWFQRPNTKSGQGSRSVGMIAYSSCHLYSFTLLTRPTLKVISSQWRYFYHPLSHPWIFWQHSLGISLLFYTLILAKTCCDVTTSLINKLFEESHNLLVDQEHLSKNS